MIVVIDSNVLSACVPRASQHRWLFDALRAGAFRYGISTDILEEYEEHLGWYYSPKLAENVVEGLKNSRNAILVSPSYFWRFIEADPDDNKFVDCAIACAADYLITEDGHFKVLDSIAFPKVRRVTLAQFKQVFELRTA